MNELLQEGIHHEHEHCDCLTELLKLEPSGLRQQVKPSSGLRWNWAQVYALKPCSAPSRPEHVGVL